MNVATVGALVCALGLAACGDQPAQTVDSRGTPKTERAPVADNSATRYAAGLASAPPKARAAADQANQIIAQTQKDVEQAMRDFR